MKKSTKGFWGFLAIIYVAAQSILAMLSRGETVGRKIAEMGVESFLNHLISPPPYVLLGLVIFGLYGIYQSQAFSPPPPLNIAPDWELNGLFLYLAPSLKYNRGDPTGMKYLAVAKEILDRLSSGQLQAWGQPIGGPLQKIEAEYWRHVDFEHWLLDGDGVLATKVRPGRELMGLPNYRRVFVSLEEARNLWKESGSFD